MNAAIFEGLQTAVSRYRAVLAGEKRVLYLEVVPKSPSLRYSCRLRGPKAVRHRDCGMVRRRVLGKRFELTPRLEWIADVPELR